MTVIEVIYINQKELSSRKHTLTVNKGISISHGHQL